MAGSNDVKTRTEIFGWIKQHEQTFYAPRLPIHPVGVYFSPKSRNYDAASFLPSYRGTLLLLLQKHVELQIVTPRTLAEFRGQVLVLPSVTVLHEEERSQLRAFTSKGGRLIITGADATGLGTVAGMRFEECPNKAYFDQLQKDFAAGSQINPKEFLASIGPKAEISVEAPPTVATNIASVNGKTHVFMANFTGLVPRKVAVPTPQTDVRISVPARTGRTLRVLPFLGEVRSVNGQRAGDRLVFVLPTLERGAVAWIEDAQ